MMTMARSTAGLIMTMIIIDGDECDQINESARASAEIQLRRYESHSNNPDDFFS
jgi:hypothetical protein